MLSRNFALGKQSNIVLPGSRETNESLFVCLFVFYSTGEITVHFRGNRLAEKINVLMWER